MKKMTMTFLLLLGFILMAGGLVFSEENPDRQVVQKAVKRNPNFEKGSEVRWLKVLVTDSSSHKTKVKITLPIVLVEVLMSGHNGKSLQVKDDDLDLDLKKLFRELKQLGPMSLIEIEEDDCIVKIWLE